MADYTVKRIGGMEGTMGGGFRLARKELGVEAFGIQVIDLPAMYEGYPEHDHAADGQEEVFVVLVGEVDMDIDGEIVHLVAGKNIVRVGPSARRKIRTGEERARVLAIGGVPGEPYGAA